MKKLVLGGIIYAVLVWMDYTYTTKVKLNAEANVAAMLRFGWSRNASLSAGASYVKDASPWVSWSRNATLPPLTVEPVSLSVGGTIQAKVRLVPQLDVRLESLLGFYVNADPRAGTEIVFAPAFTVTTYNSGTPLGGFAYIPAGSFTMGDQSNPLVGYSSELPVHAVQVSGFYMGRTELTWLDWRTVRDWAAAHSYMDLSGRGAGKADTHPVHSISWYEMVKWCNAKSEKDGLTPCYTVSGAVYRTGSSAPDCNWSANGYRLPTEAEWEKAARGGVSGKNFPWGTDTISQSQANYYAYSGYSYDLSGAVNNYYPTYAFCNYSFGFRLARGQP